ncbi:MAG: hypothetical protein QNJ61_17665 [Desulfobacterales bacterium]|nr:hypothetical protein [Desulfobacterales bacterium]
MGLCRPAACHGRCNVMFAGRPLVMMLIGMLLLTGCGIKKDPRLPKIKTPSGVGDLRVAVAGEDILLEWTTDGLERKGEKAAQGFYVYRADEPAATEPCEGCPILFKRVALVKIYRELEPEEVLSYREPKRSGVRYIFKVVAFNDHGLLGDDSNLVRLTTD